MNIFIERTIKMAVKLTYPEILKKLDDMKALAVPPDPAEKSGCFSNYNRDCRYNPETDLYENWSQKGEGSSYWERKENDEFVLVDLDGPGIIWRFWTYLERNVKYPIKIYFDGEENPSINETLFDFFYQNGDDIACTNLPNLLSTEKSRGWLAYIPIPFQKHIKITTSVFFMHQFNYTVYPAGTEMPSFADHYSVENDIARAETDRRLEDRGSYDKAANWLQVNATIPAGETAVIFRQDGCGAINGIRFYPNFPADQDEAECLRKLVLQIYWDGHEKPAVWTPLGDFFGAAMGNHRYRTVPCGMHHLECYSNWYMPFGNGAELRIENKSSEPRTVCFQLLLESLDKDPEKLLRFHAKWHPDEYLNLDKPRFMEGGDRHPDWPVLLLEGTGRFCGMSHHVYNNWRDPVIPADSWWYGKWHPTLPYHVSTDWFWGEGREKIFVNSEKTPCSFGTGSEDDVGYAFSAEPPFPRWDSPFAAVPQVPLTGKGNTSHCRYRIADNIPFQNGLQFFVEKYKPNLWRNFLNPNEHGALYNCCYFDVICYWYMQADRDDNYPSYTAEQLWDFYHLPEEEGNGNETNNF